MDNQEERDALEAEAVPLCRSWREQHPETLEKLTVLAPYCCSAYCKRCQGLRMLDGEKLIEPNEWING